MNSKGIIRHVLERLSGNKARTSFKFFKPIVGGSLVVEDIDGRLGDMDAVG